MVRLESKVEMMSKVEHVSGKAFTAEVIKSDVPVLVDFYADWCGPCRMMGPVLERVAREVAGRGKVVKVNVDEEPDLAGRFGVSSIPAFVVFGRGEVAGRGVGVMPAEKLVKMIDSAGAKTCEACR